MPTFKPRKRVIRLYLSFIAVVAGFFAMETRGVERPQPQHHFLFIVDSSESMALHRAAAIKLVRDVITSRFDGQIESGDSIDIWTYDAENNLRGFPPQIWRQADSLRITETAAEYLEEYPFKGKADFSKVASDLSMLVSQAESLLIVIVTDGEVPFSGFHLDLEINGYLAKKERLGPGKEPFLVSVGAIDGRIRTWTAYFGSGEFGLATLPLRGEPKVSIAQSKKAEPERLQVMEHKAEPKGASATGMIASTTKNAEDFTFNFPPGTKITPVTPKSATTVRPPLAVNLALVKTNTAVGNSVSTSSNALAQTTKTNEPAAVAVMPPATNAAPQVAVTKVTNSVAVPSATNSSNAVVAAKTISGEGQPATGKGSPSASEGTALFAPGASDPSKAVSTHRATKVAAGIGGASDLGTERALRRGIYISVATGIGCLLAGTFFLFRRFRRPNESIISRSLLER